MSKKITLFLGTLAAAAVTHAENHTTLQAAVDEGNLEVKRAAQKEACHAKVDAQLAGMADPIAKIASEFGLSADLIETQSREFKLRFRKVCEGLAANARPKDNAADAAFAFLKAKQEEGVTEFDFGTIQKQMNHQTPTQARNLRILLVVMGAATKQKGGFTVNYEAPALKPILALY